MRGFTVKIIMRAKVSEVMALYAEAGWWKCPEGKRRHCHRTVQRMLSGSFAVAGAFAGAKLVGMGRCLSDGAGDAYIQDVVVLKACRGRGLGLRIITTLMKQARKQGIDWIGLIAEPGTAKFYRKLGFQPMTGHVPMLRKYQR